MKASFFIKLIIPLVITAACAGKNSGEAANDHLIKDSPVIKNITAPDTFKTGKIIPEVFCSEDAAQSYALYIPVSGNNKPLPVIYFFDPHGDGTLPLFKYRKLADEYNFILIGSNHSKNGNDWSAAENTWKALEKDSQKRLKINNHRIYTCGFSGGAKVATYIALNHSEVKGVIANGAGLTDITQKVENFSFTAIAGEGDMNMTDLVAINSNLDKTPTRHRMIFFDGKHEWAPESTMNIAFAGLQLDAMHEKIIPRDDIFIDHFIAAGKKRIAGFLGKKNFTRAENECRISISMLDGLSKEVNWFKEKDASIKSDPLYKQQQQAEEKILVTEEQIKAGYMQKFQQPDKNYWMKNIREVQLKATGKTASAAMYQRLQAYLSLAFYSFSNQLVNQNQNEGARYFVDLYKTADPTNPEAWYLSAILDARENDAGATGSDLNKAIANGFKDKGRLEQQIEFQQLGSKINLPAIEQKMKP